MALTQVRVQRDHTQSVLPTNHVGCIVGTREIDSRLRNPALVLPEGRDVVVVPFHRAVSPCFLSVSRASDVPAELLRKLPAKGMGGILGSKTNHENGL